MIKEQSCVELAALAITRSQDLRLQAEGAEQAAIIALRELMQHEEPNDLRKGNEIIVDFKDGSERVIYEGIDVSSWGNGKEFCYGVRLRHFYKKGKGKGNPHKSTIFYEGTWVYKSYEHVCDANKNITKAKG